LYEDGLPGVDDVVKRLTQAVKAMKRERAQ